MLDILLPIDLPQVNTVTLHLNRRPNSTLKLGKVGSLMGDMSGRRCCRGEDSRRKHKNPIEGAKLAKSVTASSASGFRLLPISIFEQ